MKSLSKAPPKTPREGHEVRGSDCSHCFWALSHNDFSLLPYRANTLLGYHSYPSSGRQKPDRILSWCFFSIPRDQQVYLSRNSPLQKKSRSSHRPCMGWGGIRTRGAAAASSTYKVRKPALLVGQSLKVSKREQPMLKRLGGNEKQLDETLSERKCLRKLWKGAGCSRTGCKVRLVDVVYLEDCLSLWEQPAAGGGFRVDNHGLRSATCSARSWLPPRLSGGCVAHKRL